MLSRLLIPALVIAILSPLATAQPTPQRNNVEAEPPLPKREQYIPLAKAGYEVVEFTVNVGDRVVVGVMVAPPAGKLSADPALLMSIGTPTSHVIPPNDLPAKAFWNAGHRVVAFFVPVVERDIADFRNLEINGERPADTFVEDGKAVLDYCIAQGWAKPGRVVVSGISRFGYLGYRLLGADDRIIAAAGFSPVTDWRDLAEFAEQKDLPQVAGLQLSNYIDGMVGKKVYIVIGSQDQRVGTTSACRFYVALSDANAKAGVSPGNVDLFVTTDPGHQCSDPWVERGMEFLLKSLDDVK